MFGRQFDEPLAGRQMGVIASLGAGVLRLLAPLPRGFVGLVFGIIQVIGAVIPSLGFGTSSEEIGLELAFLAFELFDLLLQRGDAVEGIAMTRLPISDLLTEFEILALQAMDSSAELANFPAHVLHQSIRSEEESLGQTGLGS